MNNSPSITICIPTYERAVMLDRCLTALYDVQKQGHTFNLIVGDNGSTDNTKEVIARWQPKFARMETIFHSTNLGPDRNMYSLYMAVKTEYCWLLGDCDSIRPHDFAKIEKRLQEGYDVLVINTDESLLVRETKIYTNVKDFLNEQGWHVTKLSACVIKSNILDAKTIRRYFDSHFVQWGHLMEYLCMADTMNVLFDPDIPLVYLPDGGNNRQSQKGAWRQIPFYVWARCWSQMVLSLPIKIPYDLKMKVIKDHERKYHWFSIKNLIKNKIMFGEPYIRNYKENRQFVKMASVASPVLSDIVMYMPVELGFKWLIALKNLLRK